MCKKIAILGAGISGLAVAWYLQQKYSNRIELTVYERSDRVGGWIRSIERDGFHLECGPRCLLSKGRGTSTLKLVHAIDLDKKIIAANQNARHRFIGYKGKLNRFSLGFLVRQGGIGAVLRDLFTARSPLEDETIAAFACRRFNQKIADMVMDPLAKGIFGGDSHQLSIRSSLPLLWDYEQKYGSVIKGAIASYKKRKVAQSSQPHLYSFKGGMETLPQTLALHIKAPILFNQEVQSWNDVEGDYIISTLPTKALATIMGCKDPLDYSTLSLVHVGWNKPLLKHSGYGFLLPSKEEGEILGMTWDSEMFPQFNQGVQTRVTAMVAGIYPEHDLRTKTLRALSTYMGITETPNLCWVTQAQQAIPQYKLFHHQTVHQFKQQLPSHCFAIGSGFEGVGVNDVIAGAEKFVNNFSF